LTGGSAWLRKQDERDRAEAKQKGEYEAEFKECGLGSGFLFHWIEFGMSDAFAEMPNSASTEHFDFHWLEQWNALST
jgi:hypothetical protein